jgi:archaellum component FlaC
VAKQEFLRDGLQQLPIPTNKDMDDLYKELYLLKKRIKALEKKVEQVVNRGNPAESRERPGDIGH